MEWRGTDSGPILDARARAEYRSRLRELDAAREAAIRDPDGEGLLRVTAERQSLARELARASGLNGRDRGGPSDSERVRLLVTKRIKSAIRLLGSVDAGLARHLNQRLRTGYMCSYRDESERGWNV